MGPPCLSPSLIFIFFSLLFSQAKVELLVYIRLSSKHIFIHSSPSLYIPPETHYKSVSTFCRNIGKEMVSQKLAVPIINVMVLVLLLFIYESEGASYSSSSSSSGSHIDGAEITAPPLPIAHQKVNLSVYYESLNEPCAVFIVKNLEEIFYNDVINIVNLQLVPWANASVNRTNNSISCQVLFYLYFNSLSYIL